MDPHEQVVSFMADPAQALGSSRPILREVLECHICNSLMLDPYTLHCGHTFCGKCLKLWIKERQDRSTCPQCRRDIVYEPSASLALRELALAVAASWNESPHLPKFSAEDLVNKDPLVFFPNGLKSYAIYDADDDVYRCPNCSHEVEDDECLNCGRRFRSTDFDIARSSDEGDEVEFSEAEEEDEVEDDEEADDLNSFIDDEEQEEQEFAAQFQQFQSRLIADRRNRVQYDSIPHASEDLMEAFYRHIYTQVYYPTQSTESEQRHQELDSRIGPNFAHMYRLLAVGDRPNFADEENEPSSNTDASPDGSTDSGATSDDSLLAETRLETGRKRKAMMDDSDDSDLEVVDVRPHRSVVIDDD